MCPEGNQKLTCSASQVSRQQDISGISIMINFKITISSDTLLLMIINAMKGETLLLLTFSPLPPEWVHCVNICSYIAPRNIWRVVPGSSVTFPTRGESETGIKYQYGPGLACLCLCIVRSLLTGSLHLVIIWGLCHLSDCDSVTVIVCFCPHR